MLISEEFSSFVSHSGDVSEEGAAYFYGVWLLPTVTVSADVKAVDKLVDFLSPVNSSCEHSDIAAPCKTQFSGGILFK